MKAVISNRIYINSTPELDEILEKELIYVIDQRPISEFPLIINNVTKVGSKVKTIPSGRSDLIPEDYVIVDKRVRPTTKIPKPSFIPRDNQQEAIDQMEEGIINAKPGWGKTIAALGIAHKLQTKTLIVCTTTVIRNMWIAEIKKWFGFEPGVLGSGKVKMDSPIVVSNIQTLRNHCDKYAKDFGLVIVDEVHRSAASTFTKTLNTFHARFKLGLSGTLERKDELHCVIPDYFGNKLFIAVDENRLDPVVHFWDMDIPISHNEFMPWSTQMTKLYKNPLYLNGVLKLAEIYADAGHKILGLASMVDPLEYWHRNTSDTSLIVTGKITKNRDEIFNEINRQGSPATVLWGTQSIFSEGVSINALSCVILGAPLNNDPLLEQIVGRIQRPHVYPDGASKLSPVVIDIGLSGNTGKNQKNSRKKFYINKGWKVKNMGKIS